LRGGLVVRRRAQPSPVSARTTVTALQQLQANDVLELRRHFLQRAESEGGLDGLPLVLARLGGQLSLERREVDELEIVKPTLGLSIEA
jgi:hypothetical protein